MELKELVYATLGGSTETGPFKQDIAPQTEAFLESMECSFKRCGAEPSPLLALRTADVISAWLTVRELETALRSGETPPPIVQGGKAPPKTREAPEPQEGPARARSTRPKPDPGLEALSKAWDRLRKAVKDLEEMLPDKPPMQSLALPSLVAPLFEKSEGVLEDALKFEERKHRKNARTNSRTRSDEAQARA